MIPNTYDLQREIQQLRREINALQVRTGRIPTRIGHGASGVTQKSLQVIIPTVLALPPIPATGFKLVFWTSADGGTGDNQIWFAAANDAKWRPMVDFTDNSGTP